MPGVRRGRVGPQHQPRQRGADLRRGLPRRPLQRLRLHRGGRPRHPRPRRQPPHRRGHRLGPDPVDAGPRAAPPAPPGRPAIARQSSTRASRRPHRPGRSAARHLVRRPHRSASPANDTGHRRLRGAPPRRPAPPAAPAPTTPPAGTPPTPRPAPPRPPARTSNPASAGPRSGPASDSNMCSSLMENHCGVKGLRRSGDNPALRPTAALARPGRQASPRGQQRPSPPAQAARRPPAANSGPRLRLRPPGRAPASCACAPR